MKGAPMTDSLPKVTFKRVMLKISGEALMGDMGFGLHPPTVQRIANEVKTVHDLGVEICMVIGGGNIFRGGTTPGKKAGMYFCCRYRQPLFHDRHRRDPARQ